jgi:peroxiredoxin
MDPVIRTGDQAPIFTLSDLHGKSHCLADYRGQIVILDFWSAECPWSERSDRQLLDDLQGWGGKVVSWAIAANANETPALLADVAFQRGLPVLLHDQGNRVADLYGAQTTPHLFVVDQAGILRYQGAFDDVTFRQRTPSLCYLREAVQALLDGRSPMPAETPPYGCMIVREIDSSA